jgi:hypothetical protein
MIEGEAEGAREPEQHGELDGHDREHQAGDELRLRENQGEIDRSADGDEEQPPQQAFERLDVALQLVAVLVVGENDPSQEGPSAGLRPT